MTHDPIPTLERSGALSERVRRGELIDEYRHMIAKLLDEIGTSMRVAAGYARTHPGDPAAQDLAARAVWEPVGTEYVLLLDAISGTPTASATGTSARDTYRRNEMNLTKHNDSDGTKQNGMGDGMNEQPQHSAAVTADEAGCQFPVGPDRQVCGRALARSGAGRPPKYCDQDGHTRAKAFAARRRFELAHSESGSGEQLGAEATGRPVTDGRISFGVLLGRFESAAEQAQRAGAEQVAQLAQILAAATEVVRTVSDPDAAAFEAEQAHRQAQVQVAEAQTIQAAAERTASEERKRAEREAELRLQADAAAEAALAEVETVRAQTAEQITRLTAETEATVTEYQRRTELAIAGEQTARELERVREETIRGELAEAINARTSAEADQAATARGAAQDKATIERLRTELETLRAEHHEEINNLHREAAEERAAARQQAAEQLAAVLTRLDQPTTAGDTNTTQTLPRRRAPARKATVADAPKSSDRGGV